MKPMNARNSNQLIAALKRHRKLRRETQAQLGESAGLPQTTVSKVEVGLIDPTLKTLFKLLSALDLEIVIQARNERDRT